MIAIRSIGIRTVNIYTIECTTEGCQTKENFTGTDETQAESNAFKRGWNICRVGPRIEHYCKACAKKQLQKRDKSNAMS